MQSGFVRINKAMKKRKSGFGNFLKKPTRKTVSRILFSAEAKRLLFICVLRCRKT